MGELRKIGEDNIELSVIELESGTKIFYRDRTVNGLLSRIRKKIGGVDAITKIRTRL